MTITPITDIPGGVIEWCDPPDEIVSTTANGPGRNWGLISAQLKANAGEWGKIDQGSNWVVVRVNKGQGYWKPLGAFEAKQRTIDGVMYVFARYVGGESSTGPGITNP